jgi:Tfp pilus assembly protein PilV
MYRILSCINSRGYILVEVTVSFCIFVFAMIFFMDMNMSIVDRTTQTEQETLFLVQARNVSQRIFSDLKIRKNPVDTDNYMQGDISDVTVSYDSTASLLSGMTLVRVKISGNKNTYTFQRVMDLPVLSGGRMLSNAF